MDQLHEPRKDRQGPYHSEDIENSVGEGSPFGIDISHRGGYVCGDGGADIFTQDHCSSHIELYPTHIQHYQSEGYRGTGGLQYEGQYGTQGKEEEHRTEAVSGPGLDESQNFGMGFEVRH